MLELPSETWKFNCSQNDFELNLIRTRKFLRTVIQSLKSLQKEDILYVKGPL